jgi:hypothetical protein
MSTSASPQHVVGAGFVEKDEEAAEAKRGDHGEANALCQSAAAGV